jgi:hypothetical protein
MESFVARALTEYQVEETATEIAGEAAWSAAQTHFGVDRFPVQWGDAIESVCA